MEFFRFVSAGCLGVLGGDQIYKHVENTPVFVSDEAAGDRGADFPSGEVTTHALIISLFMGLVGFSVLLFYVVEGGSQGPVVLLAHEDKFILLGGSVGFLLGFAGRMALCPEPLSKPKV